MRFLLKRYKKFLIGLLLLIVGFTLLFTSLIYVTSFGTRYVKEFLPLLLTTFKNTMIILPSLIIIGIGIGAWIGDDEISELFRNFNKAFGKNKHK